MFEEFEHWWREHEVELLMVDMDASDVKEALEEAGVEVAAGATVMSMRAALKHQYSGRKMNVREVFASLDLDDSGSLDRKELEAALGIFGQKDHTILYESSIPLHCHV